MTVIMNKDITSDPFWGKVRYFYTPSMKYPLNRTLFFQTGAIWSAEVFFNLGTITPILTRNFADELKTVTNFFISTIRQVTNDDQNLANSIGFKLALHTERTSDIPEVFIKNTSTPLMGTDPPLGYYEFVCRCKLNSRWELTEVQQTSIVPDSKSDTNLITLLSTPQTVSQQPLSELPKVTAPSFVSQPAPSFRSQSDPSFGSQTAPSFGSQTAPSFRSQSDPSFGSQPAPSLGSQTAFEFQTTPSQWGNIFSSFK